MKRIDSNIVIILGTGLGLILASILLPGCGKAPASPTVASIADPYPAAPSPTPTDVVAELCPDVACSGWCDYGVVSEGRFYLVSRNPAGKLFTSRLDKGDNHKTRDGRDCRFSVGPNGEVLP